MSSKNITALRITNGGALTLYTVCRDTKWYSETLDLLNAGTICRLLEKRCPKLKTITSEPPPVVESWLGSEITIKLSESMLATAKLSVNKHTESGLFSGTRDLLKLLVALGMASAPVTTAEILAAQDSRHLHITNGGALALLSVSRGVQWYTKLPDLINAATLSATLEDQVPALRRLNDIPATEQDAWLTTKFEAVMTPAQFATAKICIEGNVKKGAFSPTGDVMQLLAAFELGTGENLDDLLVDEDPPAGEPKALAAEG